MAMGQPFYTHEVSCNTCKNCFMRQTCLVSELDAKQLRIFEASRGAVRVLRKGQYLYRSGEKFNSLYLLRSGMVKANITGKDGEEQVTNFYLPGEILGIDGINKDRFHSTAIALESSSVCVLSFEKLLSLGNKFPSIQKQLWCRISREIAMQHELLLSMSHKSTEARVAEFLLTLSMRLKNIGCSATSFHLPMSRHDIGNYLGMTVETVSRILTRFEKAGYINKEKRNVTLINIQALAEICFTGTETCFCENEKDESEDHRPDRIISIAAG